MSQMQTVHTDGHEGAGESIAGTSRGLFKSPGALIWRRRDWPSPVASLNAISVKSLRSQVRQKWFDWNLVAVPELMLERNAALLLLQGQSLSQVLIPNHELVDAEGRTYQLAHLLLRVEPWTVWLPQPRLTGLVLAELGPLPAGINPTELLATLAADSAGW